MKDMYKIIFWFFVITITASILVGVMLCHFIKTTNEPKIIAYSSSYLCDTNMVKLWKAVQTAEGSETLGITQICLDDYNRIMHTGVAMENVDYVVAGAIFRDYTGYWVKRFDLEDTAENRYRIWNGGPRGYEKGYTVYAWRAVKAALETQNN